ncbi:MAG: right-handed parallel beta-helix repeat-containing protein, partial [Eggerthellaceae bacterium]|nr:right-handed parallel beta-helix repeat-containing protein [Eggerthellaceae bacterium]MBQ9067544.1 right-handed parallel beta-helix repeat-containing protein [Eggerthellaceae bacterium]
MLNSSCRFGGAVAVVLLAVCLCTFGVCAAVICPAGQAYAEVDPSIHKARIGDTGYAKVIDAVNNVQEGDTVVVLDDANETLWAFNKPSFTIDLNGHTITALYSNYPVVVLGSSSSAHVTIKNGTLTGGNNPNESSSMAGAGITALSEMKVTLENVTVKGNTARWGGAVFGSGNTIWELTDCKLEGNTAFEGGAVYLRDSAQGSFTNCTITGNTANYGGGIRVNPGSAATLEGCAVNGNTGSWYGGGVYNADGTFVMKGGSISDNTSGWGAGLELTSNASAELGGTTVARNKNERYPGGGISSKGTLVLTDCTIQANESSNDGAGLYVYGEAPSTVIEDCTFTENASGRCGGAIAFASPSTEATYLPSAQVSGTTFERNTSASDGAALYLQRTIAVDGCTFDENSCTEGYGGGIYNGDTGGLIITNPTFTGNSAKKGSDIYNTLAAKMKIMSGTVDADGEIVQVMWFTMHKTAGPDQSNWLSGTDITFTGGGTMKLSDALSDASTPEGEYTRIKRNGSDFGPINIHDGTKLTLDGYVIDGNFDRRLASYRPHITVEGGALEMTEDSRNSIQNCAGLGHFGIVRVLGKETGGSFTM